MEEGKMYSVEELAEKLIGGLPGNLKEKYDVDRMSVIIDGYMLYYENTEEVQDEDGCVIVENIDYDYLLGEVKEYLDDEDFENDDVTVDDLKEIVGQFEKL